MAANPDRSGLSDQFAQVAADLGPAVASAGREELLNSIATTARLAFGAVATSVAVLDADGETLVFLASSRGPGDPIIGLRLPLAHGIAGWCASSGQVIAVDDVARDERFARDIAEQMGYMPTSILAAPIESEEQVIGVLEILDRAAGSDDLELAGALAAHAALVLEASAAESDLARTLFEAAARASDGDLAAALQRLADAAPPPQAELAELAAAFARLGRLGAPERAAATRLVTHFLGYAAGRPPT